MNTEPVVPLGTLIQQQLDADTEFAATLDGMSDEDKAAAIATKRTSLVEAEYRRVTEYGNNQKIRAEKAEKGPKEKPNDAPAEPKDNEPQLTYKDSMALQQASVHLDDVDEVIKAARYFGNGDVAKGL